MIVSAFEENLNKEELPPSDYVTATASGKALAVYTKIKQEVDRPTLIISADSVVVILILLLKGFRRY